MTPLASGQNEFAHQFQHFVWFSPFGSQLVLLPIPTAIPTAAHHEFLSSKGCPAVVEDIYQKTESTGLTPLAHPNPPIFLSTNRLRELGRMMIF